VAVNRSSLRIIALEQGGLREAFEILLPPAARGPDTDAVAARRRQAVAARAEFDPCLQPLRVALVQGTGGDLLLETLQALGVAATVCAGPGDVPATGVDVVLLPAGLPHGATPQTCDTPYVFYGESASLPVPKPVGVLAVVRADAAPAELASVVAAAARHKAATRRAT